MAITLADRVTGVAGAKVFPDGGDVAQGTRNLLINCAEAKAGERLLIAYEDEAYGYFDAGLRTEVLRSAKALGLRAEALDVGFQPALNALPYELMARIGEFDIVLFLARLGDQLRFSELPQGPRFVVCFALDLDMLGSRFGTADYRAFCAAKRAVDRAMLAAEKITITCPAGTHVTGRVPASVRTAEDTTSRRFPMSVFSPVLANEFSGRVALGGFLTGTGCTYYEDYTVEFEGQVFALLDAGRLAGFEGEQSDVAKANAHYDRVSERFGLDRNAVHSWHAGIHPGCGFPWRARDAYLKWGGAAFGNPRILHFHTCGAEPPGEISWNLFDPTIKVDGVTLWHDGVFHLERLPKGPGILSRYPCAAEAFANPDRNVGLAEASA